MKQEPIPGRAAVIRLLALTGALWIAAAALAPLPARAADPTPSEVTAAKAVVTAIGKRDYAGAKTAITDIKHPALYRAVLWRLALHEEAGLSFEDYRGLIPAVADWPNLAILEIRAEGAIGPDDEDGDIVAWFEVRPPRSLEGWKAYIAALRRMGRADAADDAVRTVWTRLRMRRSDADAFRKEHAKVLGAPEDRDRLAMLLRSGRWRSADRLLDRTTLPAAEKAPFAVRIAMQKRARGSAAAIERALKALSATDREDMDLMFDEIRWLRRSNRTALAARRLIGAHGTITHPRRWIVERSIVVRELAEAKQTALAYRTAAKHTHSDALGIATFEFLAGWIALRLQGLPGRALPHFEKLFAISDTTISKSRGAYWAGRAARRLGNGRLARSWWQKAAAYPYTFYGQLAAAWLGQPGLSLPTDQTVTPAMRKVFEAEETVEAVRMLHLAEDRDGMRALLWQLATRASAPARFSLIADLATSVGRREMAVRAGRNGLRDGVAMIGPGFPVIALPKSVEIDPALALSIVRQESEFYVEAVSSARALGLMQLLPSTARSVARALKLPYDRERLTTDPVYNMRLGSRYLHRLLARFRGSFVLAIAAYNAGPSRANQWIKRFGDPRSSRVNLIDWIEWVPFGETRNYIQRVLENYAVYKTLAGAKTLPRVPRVRWTSRRHVNCTNTRGC